MIDNELGLEQTLFLSQLGGNNAEDSLAVTTEVAD